MGRADGSKISTWRRSIEEARLRIGLKLHLRPPWVGIFVESADRVRISLRGSRPRRQTLGFLFPFTASFRRPSGRLDRVVVKLLKLGHIYGAVISDWEVAA